MSNINYNDIFKNESELNKVELTPNSEDILKMRYYMDKPNGKKETSFEDLSRRVSRVLTAFDESDIDRKIKVEKSIYNDMLSNRFLFNSPCLFSAGVGISNNEKNSHYIYDSIPNEETYNNIRNNVSENQMLFACFVINVPDQIEGIFDSVKKAAIISKSGGGVGANFGKIREKNALIKNGEMGKASGPVSFMKTWNTMGEVVQQGGKRRSALMGMLYSNHPDIEEFIDSKTEDGVLSYFNISVAVDNLFMEAVKNDLDYCLISPKNNVVIKTLKAKDLYDKICNNAHKRGDPGIFFIDLANEDSMLKYNKDYEIASTNPCVTGDTLVATADGRNAVPFKVLAEEGKDVPVYCFDTVTHDVVIRMMRNPRLTGKKQKIFKVTLDNGESIRCTGNHKFRLTNGDIKECKDLSADDSLVIMTKTIKKLKRKNLPRANKYVHINGTYHISEKTEHRMIYEFFNGKDSIKNKVVHHKEYKNDNTLNHTILFDDDIDIKTQRKCINDYNNAIEQNYSTKIVDNIVYVKKYCENCGNPFYVPYDRREVSYCSQKCVSDSIPHYTKESIEKKKEKYRKIIESNKIEQIIVYNNLFKKLGREPFKIEWENECKINGISSALGRTEGRFKTYAELKENSKDFNHRVVNVEFVGYEDVYNGTVDEFHNYYIGGFNESTNEKIEKTVFINTLNCGEQCLPDNSACNLGSINLFEFINDDNTFNYEDFSKQIYRSIYYLDLVIDASKYPLSIIEKRTKAIRPVGLGIMGLADTAIQLGIKYNSQEFLDFSEKIASTLAKYSLLASVEIAKEKGVFKEFNSIKELLYDNLSYDKILDYLNNVVSTIDDNFDFNDVKIIDNNIDNWIIEFIESNIKYKNYIMDSIYTQLIDDDNKIPFTFKNTLKLLRNTDIIYDIIKYGLRNSRRLSIAPTGTISMILNTSSSIEPNFAFEWDRFIIDNITGEKIKKKYYHKLNTEFNKNNGLLVTANEINWINHTEPVKIFAKYIDSAISKCVAKGTKIQTNKGIINIEDFSDNRVDDTFVDISDKNIFVKDLNGDWKRVTSHYCGGHKKTYKIRFNNGFELECSANHKLMTQNGWVRAEELTTDDYVEYLETDYSEKYNGNKAITINKTKMNTNQKIVNLPTNMTTDLAKWLGMLVADGTVLNTLNGGYHISLTSGDERVSEIFKDLSFKLFGINPKIFNDKRSDNYLVSLSINSKTLSNYVESLINHGCRNKKVPIQILNGSKEEQIAFINGCTLDGYVSDNYICLFDGYSKDIRDNISAMCWGLGISNSIGCRNINQNEKTYSVRVYGENIKYFNPIELHKNVLLENKRNSKMIKINDTIKSQVVNSGNYYTDIVGVRRRKKICDDNTMMIREDALVNENIEYSDKNYYVKIKSITESENDIFDIEVEDTHSYLISGIVSHNTINLPNNATPDEIKDIYMYCFDNHIKGITIYRDGSRSGQPIVETKEKKHNENIEVINTNIVPVINEKYNDLTDLPQWLPAIRTKVKSPVGSIFVMTTFYHNQPVEIYLSAGKSGSSQKSMIESLSRVISIGLRSGVDINNIIKTLRGIAENESWVYENIDGEEVWVKSIPDALANIMVDTMKFIGNKEMLDILFSNIGSTVNQQILSISKTKGLKPNDLPKDICPKCQSKMRLEGGCLICDNCGYSPCS